MLNNIAANREDTRVILNRGLTVDENSKSGLGLRGKVDSSLIGSVDNKQMVRNLCYSQKYVQWSHFLTFTCNQRDHFGTSNIKKWIDNDEWKSNYPNFYQLELDEQKEIQYAMIEASAGMLLRCWEEVFLLFINYLRKSKSSPFKKLSAIFVRKEYQTSKGNLSHSHMMVALDYKLMSIDEKKIVDNLVRASIFDIVKPEEAEKIIEDGIFSTIDDIHTVYNDGINFLPHKCNDGCLVKNPEGTLRCRKLNNLHVSKDNTKHKFMNLPNDYSVECLQILERIGLTENLSIDKDGNVLKFKSNLPFFHPQRHIPPTNPTNDLNISPVEGYTFAACKSMQNVQVLTNTGGCSKYCLKYCAKVDEQNYVIVDVDGSGKMVTKATYLHNTKVVSSKMGEDKDRKKYQGKPSGRCIGPLEMLHLILQYPEVVRNLNFIKISTMPLELRAGTAVQSDTIVEDGAYVETSVQNFRRSLGLEGYRIHSENQLLILDDLKLSKMSIDKVTQFSLRPPEFLQLFNTL